MSVANKLILGYWNIRGLAHPIRCVLAYSKLPWEDKLYVQAGADAPIPFDKSSWFNVKETLGLRFPNLPYLLDGDIKLTQSGAILRYVARKTPELNLLGYDEASTARCDEVVCEFADAKQTMSTLMYTVGRSGAGLDFINDTLPKTLARFEAALGDDKNYWFAGQHLTIADFVMWEYLDCAQLFAEDPNYLKSHNFPKLAAFKARYEAIPAIQAYLQSPECAAISGINNQHAKFR